VVDQIHTMGRADAEEIQSAELPREITAVEQPGKTFEEKADAYMRSLLLDALKESAGNQKVAAKNLGLTYDRFRHLYRKLGVKQFVP